MLKELNSLFHSDTIKPTFLPVHVILALFIFEEHSKGLGRYRLQQELLIGSGTVRSLVTKLNKKVNFLTIKSDENKRKGHVLTEKGLTYLDEVKEKIPVIEEGDSSILKEIIIESENVSTYFCHVKNGGDKLTNGIAQRDAAIKINGVGATCLVHDGKKLTFNLGNNVEDESEQVEINEDIQNYFLTNSNLKLEKNDVIVIGLADDPRKARLVALNAALTLV